MGFLRDLFGKKPEVKETSGRNAGSYRGEKGSSGMKGVSHSVNCECTICLYGHDPDKRDCQCRSCRGLV